MATSIAAAAAASTTAQLRFLTDAAHLMRQTAPETSAFLMHRRTDVLATISASASASSNTATTASSSVAASAQAALAFTQTDAQRQHVCSSCGHILIPGSNGTTLTIQSGKPKKSAKRKRDSKSDAKADSKNSKSETKEDGHTGITKVFACGSCSRETRIALPPPPPLPKNRRAKPNKAAAKEEAAPEIQKPTLTAPSTENKHNKAAPPQPTEAAPKSTNANSKKRAKNRKAGLLALLDKNKGSDSSGFGGLGLSFDDFRKR